MNKFKKLILFFLAFALVFLGIFLMVRDKDKSQKPELLTFDNITLPQEIILADKTIPLLWTDDNEGETLIIQSDRKYYDGSTESDVYFSITNISNQEQEPQVRFLFDNNDGRGIAV